MNGDEIGVNDLTDGSHLYQPGIGYDTWIDSGPDYAQQAAHGRSTTLLFKVNTVSTVSLQITVSKENAQVQDPYYIIEKIPGDIKVMTSWN